MYRRCVFCTADLGVNEVVESFPIGRRLAFDPEKGRLWVICRACEQWNLTPLEERWEAVEDAERIFRETPLRASTEQIGLARHREGLDLVRVGDPLRPEFAAWRHGDQFGRRRRRFVRNSVVGAGVVGGIAVGSAGVVGGLVAVQIGAHLLGALNAVRHSIRPFTRIPLSDGRSLEMRRWHLAKLRPGALPELDVGGGARPAEDSDARWHLSLQHRDGTDILTGPDAVRALRTLLPMVNASGASAKDVKRAVRELEEAGGPEPYFAAAEHRARRRGWGYMPLSGLPGPIRLALEMAAHEDSERVALEGELAWLERAWRDAEEIAAIADRLTLPERVRVRLEEMKARRRSKR